MDVRWREGLWQQFGAAIAMLAQPVRDCPDELWRARLWQDPYAEFWNIAYHALFWLDLYLSGTAEGFAPPPPITLDEFDPAGTLPARPFTRAELLDYLAHCERKCRTTIEALTDEGAQRLCSISSGELSFTELLLYTMRHVQEHAAQLSLLLGQQLGRSPDWVSRAFER